MSGAYYQVTGGEPLAFCRDFRERRTAKREEFMAFVEAKGAEGFVCGFGNLAGLIFARDEAPAGWVVKSSGRTADGRRFFYPRKRSAEGKALLAEMEALGREPSPMEFADRFGVPGSLRYTKSATNYGMTTLNGVFPYTSFVAWTDAGDSFWVVLPDIDAEVARYTGDGYVCEPTGWTPPEGLKRSSRARYDLAVAAAKVAEEEAAA